MSVISEKASRASWSLFEGVKDAVSSNIVSAVSSGALKIDKGELEKLVAVVNSSIEEGYHKGHRAFTKAIDVAVQESQPTGPVTKKK